MLWTSTTAAAGGAERTGRPADAGARADPDWRSCGLAESARPPAYPFRLERTTRFITVGGTGTEAAVNASDSGRWRVATLLSADLSRTVRVPGTFNLTRARLRGALLREMDRAALAVQVIAAPQQHSLALLHFGHRSARRRGREHATGAPRQVGAPAGTTKVACPRREYESGSTRPTGHPGTAVAAVTAGRPVKAADPDSMQQRGRNLGAVRITSRHPAGRTVLGELTRSRRSP